MKNKNTRRKSTLEIVKTIATVEREREREREREGVFIELFI